MQTTSSRDNWARLVAAVIKKEQIWQLCHQDSITTVDSDFSQRDLSLRSVPSSSSRLPLATDSVVQDIEVRKNGSGTITQKLFSALLRRKKHKDDYYDGIPEYHFGLKRFSLQELQVATGNFNNKNILGPGGFGNVYKGRLADGSLVAVTKHRKLDELTIEEELEILSIVKHRNVLGPLGLCFIEKERLIVYPFMANGSVASCLRERRESQPPLDWQTRKHIALGVARGLDYLHHGCSRGIIHRNVQAASIWLDEDFEAFVADFSLATFMHSMDDIKVVRGTIGYIAPEYVSTGTWSLETDVFSYGMFLLELITAQQAFDLAKLANDDDVMLLDWVIKNLFEEKKFEIIVDPYLGGNYVDEEVERLLQIALICTQTDPEGRPTMSEIAKLLFGDGLDEAWEYYKKNWLLLHAFGGTKNQMSSTVDEEYHFGLKRFSLQELQVATGNFNDKNILGPGGFGNVYKGRLADGRQVAIKRAETSASSSYAIASKRDQEDRDNAFLNELEFLSRLNHKNLVRLLGYCEESNERVLVYEYMDNGTLSDHLQKLQSTSLMSWPKRIKVALDAARGIEYLHEYAVPPIIHRDIKSSNILLDSRWNAKVSDFGLSLLGPQEDESNLSLPAAGTMGYMDPEYYRLQLLTTKSDVYSFGVVLLELLSGCKAFHKKENGEPRNVVDYVVPCIIQDDISRVLDWRAPPPSPFEIEAVAYVGYLAADCVMPEGRDRPTMSEVVNCLDRALEACLHAGADTHRGQGVHWAPLKI